MGTQSVSSHILPSRRVSASDAAAGRKDQPLDRTLAVLEQVVAMPGRFAVATLATELAAAAQRRASGGATGSQAD